MVQQKKVESVAKISDQVKRSKATVFVDYRGMTVGEATQLRRRCREANVRYLVIKNRLAKRALSEAGVPPPEDVMRGPTAIAFAEQEPTAPARVLSEFAKACQHLAIKGGFLGTRWLNPKSVGELSKIPPREVLIARLAGSLKSPIARLAMVLQAPVAQLARALKAVAEKKAS
jgi:large subunit ribosomal protein L10